MRPCRRSASRCCPPSASRGRRPAVWPMSWMPWLARWVAVRPRSTGPWTCSCPATGAFRSRPRSCDAVVLRVPDPRASTGTSGRHRPRRPGRWLPAPPRRPSRGVRSRGVLWRRGRRLCRQRLALRAVLSGGARGAARRRRARSTCSICTIGTPARRRSGATSATPTTRSSGGPRWSSPSTTSPTTAGRRASAWASSACRSGDGIVQEDGTGIDLLRVGIERSELVNTVSPGFAAEALTPEFGMGLDGALRAKGRPVHRDPQWSGQRRLGPGHRRRHGRPVFTCRPRTGKAACRADLLTRCGFDGRDDGPVFGLIGRLDPQKGFDLVLEAAPAMLARGDRIVVQGSGHAYLADPFRALAAAHPRPGRLHRAIRSGDGTTRSMPDRTVRHAVAVRAVRPGPDDRACATGRHRSSIGRADWPTRSSTRCERRGGGTGLRLR